MSRRALVVVLPLLLGGCVTLAEPNVPRWPLTPQIIAGQEIAQLSTPTSTLTVEIADSAAERTLGLSNRPSIGSDGLLFIFDEPGQPGIWMKDMQFAIDIVWLAQGQVVAIAKDARPQPGESEAQLRVYRPPGEVDAVLEVAAGSAQAFGLEPGVKINIDELRQGR